MMGKNKLDIKFVRGLNSDEQKKFPILDSMVVPNNDWKLRIEYEDADGGVKSMEWEKFVMSFKDIDSFYDTYTLYPVMVHYNDGHSCLGFKYMPINRVYVNELKPVEVYRKIDVQCCITKRKSAPMISLIDLHNINFYNEKNDSQDRFSSIFDSEGFWRRIKFDGSAWRRRMRKSNGGSEWTHYSPTLEYSSPEKGMPPIAHIDGYGGAFEGGVRESFSYIKTVYKNLYVYRYQYKVIPLDRVYTISLVGSKWSGDGEVVNTLWDNLSGALAGELV